MPIEDRAVPGELAACHSRYAPLREAERFIEARLGDRRPSLVFVLGGGLNYIASALAPRLPGARIVLLQPCPDFDGFERGAFHARWSPGSAQTLAETVDAAFSDGKGAGGVAVLEWGPVLDRFPEMTARMRSALGSSLEREAADAATRSFWARRWLGNSLDFALEAARFSTLAPGERPIVLACAGPGLLDALPAIRAYRGGVSLWSLAAAQRCLAANGLEPDCVVTTDPGHWNTLHLRAALSSDIPVLAPPSARLPPALLGRSSIVPLSTGLRFETGALEAIAAQPVPAAASGTAAGTALSLAARATTGPVILCGLDFAARGLEDHASPYSLDALDEAQADRLGGILTQRFERIVSRFGSASGGWTGSRAFSAYASAMDSPPAARGRCYRISSSPAETGIPRAGPDAIAAAAAAYGRGTAPSFPSAPAAEGTRAAALGAFMKGLAAAAKAEAEDSLARGTPLHPETCLAFWALAGKAAAPMIAAAARGECIPEFRDSAFAALAEGLAAGLERLK